MDIESALRRVQETGKVEFGSKKAMEYIQHGKAKLIVLSINCPKEIRKDTEHYAKLADIPVLNFKGTAMQLGEVCGKPFLISTLTVLDPGRIPIEELIKTGRGATGRSGGTRKVEK